MAGVTIKDLLEAGVHFGHQTKRWNPKMKKFCSASATGSISSTCRRRSSVRGGTGVRPGPGGAGRHGPVRRTKKQAVEAIQEEALRAGMYFVNRRWLGGTLTNFQTITKSISRLKQLET